MLPQVLPQIEKLKAEKYELERRLTTRLQNQTYQNELLQREIYELKARNYALRKNAWTQKQMKKEIEELKNINNKLEKEKENLAQQLAEETRVKQGQAEGGKGN